ncbi:MAG: Ig-like domain-containing protein, partial [Chloroflexi bacterium]|nr:Ig-like domain-containing protein [Chloroflexota bacterium]
MPTIRVRSVLLAFALAAAAVVLFPPAGYADTPVVLTLTSDTDSIPADGHSQANISLEAWEGQTHYTGPLQVSLRTSLGDLNPTDLTLSAGTGWVHLRSGAASGTAVISVQVITGPHQIILPAPLGIAFLPPGVRAAPAESNRFLSAAANYLAFAVDMQRMVAIQHVRVSYQGVRITADSLTLDTTEMVVRALSLSDRPVVLKSSGRTIQARRLYLNFKAGVGIALAADPDGAVSLKNFTLRQFELSPLMGPAPLNTFADEDITGAALVIHARRFDLYPGNELHAAGASIFVSGKKILSLPFYRLSLNPYNPNGDQYVTFDTYSGIGINLPIYYMLNDGAMGSVRLEHQEQAGYLGSSTQGGWSLNLRQDYGHGIGAFGPSSGSGGTLTLDRMTSQDWGFSWRHSERLGHSATVSSYLYSPDHRGITGNLNVYAPYHGLGLSLTSFGNHEPYLDSMSSQFNIDLPQKTAFHRRVAFNLSTSLGWNYLQSTLNGIGSSNAVWMPGVASNIYLAPWILDRSTTLSPS